MGANRVLTSIFLEWYAIRALHDYTKVIQKGPFKVRAYMRTLPYCNPQAFTIIAHLTAIFKMKSDNLNYSSMINFKNKETSMINYTVVL